MDRGGDGSVVVVGGGTVGCSIALHLVDRGVAPVLIDPERPGQGTSTGSFASVSAFGKDPVAWFQLACAGMSGWQRFAHRLGTDVGLRRAGEVRFTSDPADGRRLARQVAEAVAAATRSGSSTRPSWPGCCCPTPASAPCPPRASPPTTGRWSRRWSSRRAGGPWPTPGPGW